MGPPAVSLILVIALGLTATLPGPTMVHAEGSSAPLEDTTTPNMTRVDNQCSPLQKRQDLLDTRMNESDTRLNGLDTRLRTQLSELQTQLNGLDTRLSTQLNTRQDEVNSRLNRMDSRFDGIETAISDMKGFLQERMEAIDKKVEWALTDIKPRREDLLDNWMNESDTRLNELDTRLSTQLNGLDTRLSTQLNTRQDEVNSRLNRMDSRLDGIETAISKSRVYRGCEDALTHRLYTSGVYTIAPDPDNSFNVYCEQRLDRGGWTVFQARHNGEVDFYNDWNTYKIGFGELTTEFWLGNDKIHTLTKHHNMQLKIELTSPAGEVQYADYSQFWIEDEAHKYKLTVTGYTGGSVPGDALAYHNGSRFSTRDEDNDSTCATVFKGGWWYNNCHHSNLNGLYGGTYRKGITWYQWKGDLSMKATRMMIRRRP